MHKNLFIKISNNSNNFDSDEESYLLSLLSRGILKSEGDSFAFNSKYFAAKVIIKNQSAFLEDISNEHRRLRIEFENLNGAHNDDLVIAQKNFNPRAKSKAKVIDVVSKEDKELLVYKNEGEIYTLKDGINLKVKVAISEGDVAIINQKTANIVRVLGNIKDAKVDEEISLLLYSEEYRLDGFSEFDLDDKIEFEDRVDLTALPFCTIDPASAKDHDDAIYYDVQNEILYVAIADVSHFVKEGSTLDEEAFKRSSSIYLPNRVLPMLPSSLSEELCSLKPDVNRYSYVFKIFLENSKVVRSELFEAVINSHAKFSYGRIDRVLDDKLDNYTPIQKEIFDYLQVLYKVTKNIRHERLKKGYEFRNEENRLKLDRNYELVSVDKEESTPSHQLIEECMLLANIEASNKLKNIGIYRVHEEPSFQAISKLIDEVNLLGIKASFKENVHSTILEIQKKARLMNLSKEIDELIIQSQSKAKYSSKNLGHFGLGFDSYSHFTSPIRRYSDLILHRMLKKSYNSKDIDEKCEYISEKEVLIDRLVWDLEDRKYARHAKKMIGEIFLAKVVDTERFLVETEFNINGMRIHIENYSGQKLFSKVKVKIIDSDIFHKKISGKIVF